jgi:hypothetical protein
MGEQNPYAELMRLTNGYQVTQAIQVAAVLGIADLLANGARTSDDLAAATGTHASSLHRVLRALAALGVFREDADRRFSLTPLGQCLRSDAARPVGPWAEFVGTPYHRASWGDLLHTVQTGETAFRHMYGTDIWEYRSREPEAGVLFDRAMTALSRGAAQAVVAAYDFSRFPRIVDVGGGHGAMLAAILASHPSARGVLFDQPNVVAGAAEVLEPAGVADRCEIVGGSFFAAVPGGGDVYLLKAILHDWEDAEAGAILRNCRQAAGPGATLLVLERVVALPNEDPMTKLSDLNMMVMTGGRERTEAEFAALLSAAGFRMTAVVRTGAPISVIESVGV